MPHLSIEHDGTRYMTPLRGELPIGRTVSDREGLRVTDPGVSRLHATIHSTGTTYVVVDHESKNGTYVNGKRVTAKHLLRDGDRIRVGRTRMFYHDTEHPHLRCAICQTSISDEEETAVCPDCDLIFHADCWRENLGCAAYGCKQVNALADNAEPMALEEVPDDTEADEPPRGHVLLAAAALASLIGALLFGVPAFFVLVAGIAMRKRFAGWAWPIALIVAALGTAAGAVVSYIWWLT